MSTVRPAAVLAALLAAAAVSAVTTGQQEHRAKLKPAQRRDRSAMLVVPAFRPPTLNRLFQDSGARTGPAGDELLLEVPEGYKLMTQYAPNPLLPDLQYFVYVDLSVPGTAQRWREFQRAYWAAFREERERRRDERDMARCERRLLQSHQEALDAGLEQLRAGRYRQALLAFTLAAELNHADPACRIHLAMARLALGHDADAARALRRALELQPKLVPIPLHLERDFATPEIFDAQIDGLAERLRMNPEATAEEYFLLGFLEFQRDNHNQAHTAFRRALNGLHDDERLFQYLRLTKPAAN